MRLLFCLRASSVLGLLRLSRTPGSVEEVEDPLSDDGGGHIGFSDNGDFCFLSFFLFTSSGAFF